MRSSNIFDFWTVGQEEREEPLEQAGIELDYEVSERVDPAVNLSAPFAPQLHSTALTEIIEKHLVCYSNQLVVIVEICALVTCFQDTPFAVRKSLFFSVSDEDDDMIQERLSKYVFKLFVFLSSGCLASKFELVSGVLNRHLLRGRSLQFPSILQMLRRD